MDLKELCRMLLDFYKMKGWWPSGRGFEPKELEVAVGAILTQNTNWGNVEKALDAMVRNGLKSLESIISTERTRLEEIIRPSGFYRQKAERLEALARHIFSFGSFGNFSREATREGLLEIKGVGPETADSILLYACGKPSFVVDAYTRRILERTGITEDSGYDMIKEMFERVLPLDYKVYGRCHAAIVEHAKRYCRKKPLCQECPLRRGCASSPV